ncbi:hypothetical protein [Flavobacterium sp. Root186]|uniref:hypothetical protein n=1 Tax=Flavobacterium sp. Root186 TaxID=1736485 RepID=UPI0006FAAB5F|nr:hypothetical protein [Flavobacterium sp. Root186]KRB58127.1 hypothetical protein ASD98_07665 [Flavobacterium sp. Root186]
MKELYPELIDYIFQYFWKYYSETERKAIDHNFGAVKFGKYPDNTHPKIDEVKKRFLTTDNEVLKLLENGYSEFIKNTAIRIFNEHGNELELNLCPKCEKIARTPKAKQCRFCGNDWH